MRVFSLRTVVLFVLAALALPSLGQDAALQARAEAGDAASQVQLGDALAAGSGGIRASKQIEADYRAAAEWYRRAAAQKDPAGQRRLAALYRDGKGMGRDLTQAAALYREAAEACDAEAQATLATLYTFGQGVGKSDVEAYYWYDLAAHAEGPNQQKYAANRQRVGTRITAQELEAVQERVEKWLAAHKGVR